VRLLEGLLVVIASLAIAVGVIAVLSGGLLAGRDNPGLYGPGGQLGVQFRDLGDATLAPGAKTPVYDSSPPTSGPHRTALLHRDGTDITDDQLLTALAAGNVVFLYGTRRPPAGLRALANSVAAPFTPALAAAGQAVILGHRADIPGVIGLAWTRGLHVRTPTDPQLRSFALVWLGHGARAAA
jgi:hypothetical protein